MDQTQDQSFGVHPSSGSRNGDASGVVRSDKSQPLLTLSGIGLALGSVLRRIKRVTTLKAFKLPRIPRKLPGYMKSNSVKYPVLFFVLLAAARKVRLAINQ